MKIEEEFSQTYFLDNVNPLIDWFKREFMEEIKNPDTRKMYEKEIGEEGIKAIEELVRLDDSGICSGLVNKWLKKYLQGEPEKFFDKMLVKLPIGLAAYLENVSIDVAVKDDQLAKIFKFAKKILVLQKPTTFTRNGKTVSQDNLKHLQLEFLAKTNLVLSRSNLVELIEALKANRVYRIGSPTHAIGLAIENDKYVLYDPNEEEGQKTFSTSEEVANYLFDESFEKKLKEHNNLSFELCTYLHRPKDLIKLKPLKDDLTALRQWLVVNQIKNPFVENRLIYLLNDIEDGQKPIEQNAVKIYQIIKQNPELFEDLPQLKNLIQFIKNNHESIDLTENLLDKLPINSKGTHGTTSLFYIIKQGNLALVEKMISKGAHLNNRDDNGYSPLHRAVKEHKLKIAELLISKGAALNTKDDKGNTPLNLAVRSQDYNMAKALIAAGADVNKKNKNGKTPLDRAIKNEDTLLAKLLIKNNAEINDPIATADLLKKSISIPPVHDKYNTRLKSLFWEVAIRYEKKNDLKKKAEFLSLAAQLGSTDAHEELLTLPSKINRESLAKVNSGYLLERLQDLKESLEENKKYFIYRTLPKHKQKVDVELQTIDQLMKKIVKLHNKSNNVADIEKIIQKTYDDLTKHFATNKLETNTSSLLRILKTFPERSHREILDERKGEARELSPAAVKV